MKTFKNCIVLIMIMTISIVANGLSSSTAEVKKSITDGPALAEKYAENR